MLKIILVDDEPLAIENLRCLLQQHSDIEIIAECPNAIEAISAIHRLRPDVIFLDIHMPRLSGLEMLSMIDPSFMPHIVFLTAYDHYAVQAFEAQAFDYLLKPIDEQRLHKTMARLKHQRIEQNITQLTGLSDNQLKYIPCVGHSKIYLLNMNDVLFVSSRASGNYVTSLDSSEYFTELTLRTLEERTTLVRCHRQYLVNIQQLKEIRFNTTGQIDIILTNGAAVPVSRRYFKSLKALLSL
ncbi:two-component system response regulator BtsR [Utexia brackfieldae]|uniref:two-component system response regulator BtsR n=1 Tax=Utexia brackfieldae TaxID=3074108 RepID=UPI00370D46D7